MGYDRENRLTTAASASLAVNYSYDPLGRLIERRTTGAVAETNRMYYAGWQLIAEYNGAGTLQRKYVYGPGIDEPVRMTVAASPLPLTYYFHADGLGSVTEITGNTGQLVESYCYDAYGTPTFFSPAGLQQPASTINNRLLFTARDRDPDTTWYNYRYRYYNPTLGRFVQPDPIGVAGGDGNLYRYCRNNPVVCSDPSGMWSWRATMRVGGVVLGAVVVGVAVAVFAPVILPALSASTAAIIMTTTAGGIVGGIAGGQAAVNVQMLVLPQSEVDAARQANNRTIAHLKEVVASEGAKRLECTTTGVMGAELPENAPGQKANNIWESVFNVYGWGSGVQEGVGNLGNGTHRAEADATWTDWQREQYAERMIYRLQRYNEFLDLY